MYAKRESMLGMCVVRELPCIGSWSVFVVLYRTSFDIGLYPLLFLAWICLTQIENGTSVIISKYYLKLIQ